MRRKKTEKQLYIDNTEAARFMEKHPELFGWDANSTHDKPGNAQWACTEPPADKVDKAWQLQLYLKSYPKGRERTALEMYFDGKSTDELQAFLGHERKSSTVKFIWKVKGKVMKHGNCKKRKKLNLKNRKIVAQSSHELGNERKCVYLIYTPKSNNYVWVDEDYRILPEDVQDYLDSSLQNLDTYKIV